MFKTFILSYFGLPGMLGLKGSVFDFFSIKQALNFDNLHKTGMPKE
jgi:hypothetical protein